MTLHTLSSGSQGNCLLLSDGDTHILVDAGISTRRIKAGLAQLELSMDELDGILITHEHTDHISGLATLIKHHSIPLYTSPGTARQLAYRLAGVEPLLRPRRGLFSRRPLEETEQLPTIPEPEPEPDCSDEGQPKTKRRPDGSWKCMFCDHMNPSGKDYCQKCGAEAFFDQP